MATAGDLLEELSDRPALYEPVIRADMALPACLSRLAMDLLSVDCGKLTVAEVHDR